MDAPINPRALGPTSMGIQKADPTKHCRKCGQDFVSLDAKCPECTSKP